MNMGKIVAKWNTIKEAVRTDENLIRARRGIIRGGKALPGATGRYLVQKVPVVQWIPNYMPKWIVNDAVAGLTVGVLLIPQALAYAALAGIPLQQGLLASWLPSAIYFIMGTSKGTIKLKLFEAED
jgi:sodium-independent sulfate anion transporter 11